jgi:multidrug efflux pump
VQQFPDIAPPQVNINATYPGASRHAGKQRDAGDRTAAYRADGLLYFSSTSSAGTVAITATFAKGTNPDIAQVQVQNKVQQALTRLPASAGAGRARHQVEPRLPDDGALADTYDRTTNIDVSDFMVSHCRRPSGAFRAWADQCVRLAICDARLARSQQAGSYR